MVIWVVNGAFLWRGLKVWTVHCLGNRPLVRIELKSLVMGSIIGGTHIFNISLGMPSIPHAFFLFFSELVDAKISVALIWKFSSLKTKSLLCFINDSTCSLWVWSIECGRLNSFEKCSFHSSAEIGFSLCEASRFRNLFRVPRKLWDWSFVSYLVCPIPFCHNYVCFVFKDCL